MCLSFTLWGLFTEVVHVELLYEIHIFSFVCDVQYVISVLCGAVCMVCIQHVFGVVTSGAVVLFMESALFKYREEHSCFPTYSLGQSWNFNWYMLYGWFFFVLLSLAVAACLLHFCFWMIYLYLCFWKFYDSVGAPITPPPVLVAFAPSMLARRVAAYTPLFHTRYSSVSWISLHCRDYLRRKEVCDKRTCSPQKYKPLQKRKSNLLIG